MCEAIELSFEVVSGVLYGASHPKGNENFWGCLGEVSGPFVSMDFRTASAKVYSISVLTIYQRNYY